jgi:hypothetical protein
MTQRRITVGLVAAQASRSRQRLNRRGPVRRRACLLRRALIRPLRDLEDAA